jgi:hypothetical protein
LLWLETRHWHLPEVGEYQQVFTVAMVIVEVRVTQTNAQLFKFDHGHVRLGQLALLGVWIV